MFIRKSVFDKSVFRSICKILFLLVEIFSLVFISLFVEDNLSGHDEFWEFLEYLSGMIIVIYIISIPIILAVSIFNFLHQFNDYDSVRDCLFSLLYAPAALIFHTFKHLLHTIAYLFGYEFPIERVHDTDYYTTSYTTPQSTGSSNTQKANTAAKTGHTSPIPDGKDISKFNDIINKKASAIAWNSRPAPLVPSGSEAYW